MTKSVCRFTTNNDQLRDIAAEVQKAMSTDIGVAETILTGLASHARELVAAYREEITSIRSSAGGDFRGLAAMYEREVEALEALVSATNLPSLQAAAKRLSAVSPRVRQP